MTRRVRLLQAGCASAFAVFAGGRLAAAGAQPAPPPIDASFAAFWASAHGRPYALQEAAWDRSIERPRRDLYASVVWQVRANPRWREEKDRDLRRRFAAYERIAERLPADARAMEAQVPLEIGRFRGWFPDAPERLAVQVVLAPNFDAKSGVLGDGTPVLALAVDTLVLGHEDLSVIFPHELFHLYHALHAGVRNDGVMAGADLTLPLFAEGLATYVSSLLAPGHSEGQLLLQGDLGALPAQRLPEVARRFLADADRPATDMDVRGARARWFMGSDTALQSNLPNRTGYWLGLNLIRDLRRRYSLHDLASWPPPQAQARTRAALLELAGEPRAVAP